jgi:hypothetical protein
MKLMKKVAVLVGVGFAVVGCGKDAPKTLSASQVMNSSYLSSNCTNSQISMSVTESNNNVVGSGSSACFTSESIQGTKNGSGQLTNVVLSITIASQAMSQYNSGYSGSSYYCSQYQQYCPQNVTTSQAVTCTYTGTLSYSNNNMNGQLSTSQYYQQSGNSAQCPSTIYLNGNLSG